MSPLFEKLDLEAQSEIVGLDAPEGFEPARAVLDGVTVRCAEFVRRTPRAPAAAAR